MARPPSTQPTLVELQILRVLWQHGPSTVRQVHLALSSQRDTGYSTTLKMMQVMTGKSLLRRDETQRPQVYRPTMSEEAAQTSLVDDLVQRAFGGAADKLILRTLSSKRVSAQELSQIRKLLQKLEERGRHAES
jgi:BlaI family transcriptional regulator, penicillinase repressor